ncbi:hypothetical protein [Flexithrix dorotheae]|uniref:hypothetical protein n=1 Tax=Flexithrix dorotheae TaxID=70993 RepID=UPI0003729AC9|nr:hypothetical protein [Flexithrix dorotheae]
MKKTTYLILLLLFSYSVYGQAPMGINYQGLALDEEEKPIRNKEIGIRISILTSSIEGATIYAEQHQVETSSFGLFNLTIGKGESQNGDFSQIEWGKAPKFLKLEIDKSGRQNYKLLGVTQFLSVPYALYAEKTKNNLIAGKGIKLDGDSLINSLPDQEIQITGSGSTEVSGSYPYFNIYTKDSIVTSDIDSTNEIQYLSYENNRLSLSKGNSILFPQPDSFWHYKNQDIIFTLNRKLGLGTASPSSRLHIEDNTTGLDSNRYFITLDNKSIDYGSAVGVKLHSGSSGSTTVLGHHSSSYGNLSLADFGQVMSTGKGLILRAYSTNGILSFQTGINGPESYEWMRLSNDGNLGIGTMSPQAKLQVTDGDIYIENIDKGIIMKSPNGNCWRVTIDDNGDFVKNQITCP